MKIEANLVADCHMAVATDYSAMRLTPNGAALEGVRHRCTPPSKGAATENPEGELESRL